MDGRKEYLSVLCEATLNIYYVIHFVKLLSKPVPTDEECTTTTIRVKSEREKNARQKVFIYQIQA